jgi:hypothetical protein
MPAPFTIDRERTDHPPMRAALATLAAPERAP